VTERVLARRHLNRAFAVEREREALEAFHA
jgi:hypothetical protein